MNIYIKFILLINLLLPNVGLTQTPIGEILDVAKSEVSINLGSSNGIIIGDMFQIFGRGETIHPATGQLIVRDNVFIGTIRAIKVNLGTSICEVVKASNTFRKGDKVRRISELKTDVLEQEVKTIDEFERPKKRAYEETIYTRRSRTAFTQPNYFMGLRSLIGFNTEMIPIFLSYSRRVEYNHQDYLIRMNVGFLTFLDKHDYDYRIEIPGIDLRDVDVYVHQNDFRLMIIIEALKDFGDNVYFKPYLSAGLGFYKITGIGQYRLYDPVSGRYRWLSPDRKDEIKYFLYPKSGFFINTPIKLSIDLGVGFILTTDAEVNLPEELENLVPPPRISLNTFTIDLSLYFAF